MPSYKSAKISSDMMRVISEIIFTEARDELLKTITITACRVSHDLSYAKVYFTSFSDLGKKELEKEINEAAPFIRTEVSQRLNLRHTPELEFIFDESIEYGKKIENLIKEIHEEN